MKGLQRYQIMESLGHGSQGHTYRAIDRRGGEEVAVKVLSLGQAKDWKPFELFEREAKVLEQLEHPGIPRYRDYFTSEASGDYFLVMDLVQGRSLDQDLQQGRLHDEARLRELLEGLLDILAYLHSRTPPVIHRDIKPGNIILDARGRVHLVDFGGVRLAAQVEGGSTMIGTYGYMAPEQLHGDAGPGVDLYALGATITALATGKAADDLPHAGLAIDLDQLRLPESLRPLLRGLLQPDPRERITSVAGARAALRSDRPSPSGTSKKSPAASPRKGKGKGKEAPKPNTQALAEIPPAVQELARISQPLSIFAWLAALFSMGGLVVLEYLALPIVYLILVAFADRKAKQGGRGEDVVDEDEAGITSLRELRKTTARSRRYLKYIIDETSPFGDD